MRSVIPCLAPVCPAQVNCYSSSTGVLVGGALLQEATEGSSGGIGAAVHSGAAVVEQACPLHQAEFLLAAMAC